jgi:hypothetical protein
MHLNLNHFSGTRYAPEHRKLIEKPADNLLVINDVRTLAFFTVGITTSIDLADRTLKRTWNMGAFSWKRVDSMNDFPTVEIDDKGGVIEGYSLPFFSVQLTGRRGQIAVYSTDDNEDAKAVQVAISGFLRKAGISTQINE